MQPSISVIIIFKLLILTSLPIPVNSQATCRNLCGGIAINYPFGVDDGCGAPEYRNMLNCTGDLFFETPSGSYKVRSIDYEKRTVVIFDPGMSTCTTLQPRHDFTMSEIQSIVIPPSPDSVFALLNCSIDSPVLNHYRSACFNFSGHSCDEIYGACSSFQIFNVSLGYPPCCFTDFSTVKFMSMNILDCTHYTTLYNADDLKGVGPLDWPYGLRLSYAVSERGCSHCMDSGGTCGFNTETEGLLCLCSTTFNSTRECGLGAPLNRLNTSMAKGGCLKMIPSTLLHVLVLILTIFF